MADRFDQFALFGGQFAFQQQSGHGDDAVHGRADFVAHVGQELGFSARSGLGGHLGGFQIVVCPRQLVLELLVAQGGPNTRAQLGDLTRFGDVIGRSEFETADLIRCVVPGGEDDDRDVAQIGLLLQFLEHCEAVVFRKAEVEQDEIDLVAPREFEAIAPVPSAPESDVVLLQAGDEQVVQTLLVIDQKNLWRGRAHPGTVHCPSGTTIVIPAISRKVYLFLLFLLKHKTDPTVFVGHLAEQFSRFRQLSRRGQLFQVGAQSGEPTSAEVAGASLQAVGRFL